MPISINWNSDKTILYFTIVGEWSLDDAWDVLNNRTLKLTSEVSHVPDTIMDFSNTKITPSGLLNFWRRTYNWMQINHLETSMVTFVQAPPAIKGIGETLRNLRVPIMRYMFFVDSVEDGHKLIEEYRINNPRQALENK